MRAANELLSDRAENEAYLAAAPGRAYALYFPAGGQVGLDMTGAAGEFTAHWIDISTGEWGPKTRLTGGARVQIAPPGAGNWAAAIVKR